MLEAQYQRKLVKDIKNLLPGCEIIKNDPAVMQGMPDLLVLFEDKWAMLEVKVEKESVVQPNQNYYIAKFSEMSYASFIYPENEEEVLSELQSALRTPREARIS